MDRSILAVDFSKLTYEQAERKLEEAQKQYTVAMERFNELESFRDRLLAAGGIDKETAMSMEAFSPGLITSKMNLNGFTQTASHTNYDLTLEQLNVSLEDAGMIFLTIFLFIVGLIGFIINMLSGSSSSGRSTNEIYFKFESTRDYHIWLNNRSTKIDSHFSQSEFEEYKEKMNAYLKSHLGSQLDASEHSRRLLSTNDRSTYGDVLRKFLDEAFSRTIVEKQTGLTSLLGNQFAGILKDLPSSQENQTKLMDAVIKTMPFIITQIDGLDKMFDSINKAVNEKIDAMMRTVVHGKPIDYNGQAIVEDLNRSNAGAIKLKTINDNLQLIVDGGPKPRLTSEFDPGRRLAEVIRSSGIIEGGKRHLQYKGERIDPYHFIQTLPKLDSRPTKKLDIEQANARFKKIHDYFKEMSEKSEKGLDAVLGNRSEDNTTNNLRARVLKYYLTNTQHVFRDIAAAIQAALIFDQCYSNLAVALDRAYRHDCEAYLYHYKTLQVVASNDELREPYKRMHGDLRAEYDKYLDRK